MKHIEVTETMKNKKEQYLIKVSSYQPTMKIKKLKRPKPKIKIISINTGSVFNEY